MDYNRGSVLDYELDKKYSGLSFRCNDDDKSTLLIKLTLIMAQVRIQIPTT